jgi:hypothetical protein
MHIFQRCNYLSNEERTIKTNKRMLQLKRYMVNKMLTNASTRQIIQPYNKKSVKNMELHD